MKRLPKYLLTIPKGNETENPIIISTDYPYIYGEVKFIAPDHISSLIDDIANERVNAAKIPGYKVVIFLAGSMERERLTPDKVRDILRGMADFYLNGWIAEHKYSYDKKYSD